MNVNSENVLIIRAKGDSEYYGFREYGYKVLDPYKGYVLFLRIIREIFFRLHLPFCSIWFNKDVLSGNYEGIIVYDPLITKKYLKWLAKHCVCKHFVYFYENLVGNARNILPKKIPQNYSVWTYDKNDAVKYGIKLNEKSFISKKAYIQKRCPKYDVFFVGKDKGRAEYLLQLEKELNALGLVTYFHIVADSKFMAKKKRYYKSVMPYDQVLQYISESRAILNLVYKDQVGLSMRDMEAMHNKIKLITNNKNIIQCEFYRSENIFILGVDELRKLPSFLDSEFVPLDESFADAYSVCSQINTFFNREN